MSIRFRNLLFAAALLAATASAYAAPGQHRKPDRRSNATAATQTRNAADAQAAQTQVAAAQTPANSKGYRIAAPADEVNPVPLDAMLLLSTQYAVQDMYFLLPPRFAPTLNSTDTIYVGQSVALVPIVRRYAINNEGNVDVRYKPTSVLPSGEIEDDLGEAPLYVGKAPRDMAQLFPPEGLNYFYAGEDQGTGTFILRVEITDRTSGETRMLEQPITVLPYEVPTLPEDFNANMWMLNYYGAPSPGLALPALFALTEAMDSTQLNAVTPPVLGFYDRLLRQNSWLLPHFSTRLEESLDKVNQGGRPSSADVILGLVLSFHLRDAEERPEQISERIWLETESNRQFDWGHIDPGTSEFIYYPQQLDYLWGQFLASGAYSPVYRLLRVLLQDTETTEAASPQLIRNLSEDQRTALAEGVIRGARWSLGSNALKHRLVLAYMLGTTLRADDGISEEDRKQLETIVIEIVRTHFEQAGKTTVTEDDAPAQQEGDATPPAAQ